MSTSTPPPGVLRCSRTVYERITGRSSSGIPRQAPNQVSSSVDGRMVCSWWAGGRKSERLWSQPPERNPARDAPPKVTRRNECPSRRVRTTSSSKKRKWATAWSASVAESDAVAVMRRSPLGFERVPGGGCRPSAVSRQPTFLAFWMALARSSRTWAHFSYE